ncbi:MAG: hypothetical protein ABJH98_12530 [Reichenbachiella sp.]
MRKPFNQKIISILLFLLLGLTPWTSQGQDGTASDEQTEEQMKGVVEAFLDWAAISFATYTGQHEAEMGSIFAKAKDGLEKYPELQELINDNTNGQGGMLAEGVNALTTKTGVKVYFLPEIANPDNKFYINSFNGFLAEGSANLIPPYILVKMDVSGNNESGYAVSCTVETSDDVKSKKYNLKTMDADNPFFALNTTVPERKNMASHMKLSLYNGVGALHDEMDGSLREDLSILHAGTLYRTGEELEVAYDKDKPTVLQVEDKDGQAPNKSVTWSLDPSDAEFETSGHQLTLAPQAGQWKVTASAGNKNTHIFLKSVDFNLDWKDIVKTLLYEALQTKLDQTKAKIDSLEAASPGYDSELQSQLQKIEAANYPLETNSNPLFSAYEQPQVLTGEDTVKFYGNPVRAEGFEKLRKFKGHLVDVLQQVNMAAFIDILVEDPKRFETLLNNMGDNISSLVIELVASGLNRTERDQKIKDVIFNYLNTHLVQLADAEFASKHESYELSAAARPEPNNQKPTLKNENYYINPLVHFKGKEEFEAELSTNLAAMDDPPFVVINYSQDLSSEGYLNRAKAGKPKGIGDRPYKVYTLVNIPGSVMMDVFSEDGSTPSDALNSSVPSKDIFSYIQAKAKELNMSNEDVLAILHCKACQENNSLTEIETTTHKSVEFGTFNATAFTINAPSLKCISIFYDQKTSNLNLTMRESSGGSRPEDEAGLKITFVDESEWRCTNELETLDSLLNCQWQNSDLSIKYIDQLYQEVLNCLEQQINPLDFKTDFSFSYAQNENFEDVVKEVNNKLKNEFFSDVKIAVNLTNNLGYSGTLSTEGLTNIDQAELNLKIHIDESKGRAYLNIEASESFLSEFVELRKQDALARGIDVNVEELRRQVIEDLESVATHDMFSSFSQALKSIFSQKIGAFVEVVQTTQKASKTVWKDGQMSQAHWWSKANDRPGWPEYAKMDPLAAGPVDGIIDEVVGIPMAIRSMYGIMTDNEQRQAFKQVFTAEGMSALVDGVSKELNETLNDDEKLKHAGGKTVVSVASMFITGGISKTGKGMSRLQEMIESLSELKEFKRLTAFLEDSKKLDRFDKPAFEILKKQFDEVFDKFPTNREHLDKIIGFTGRNVFRTKWLPMIHRFKDVPGMDKVLKELGEQWTKNVGHKFVLEFSDQMLSSGNIKKILKFEASDFDGGKRIYDIVFENKFGKPIRAELKNWRKFNASNFKGQFLKDLGKMEELGELKWFFKKSDGIDADNLKDQVLAALKKGENPIQELDNIPLEQVKKLLGDDFGLLNQANKSKKLLQGLENDTIFKSIFEVI